MQLATRSRANGSIPEAVSTVFVSGRCEQQDGGGCWRPKALLARSITRVFEGGRVWRRLRELYHTRIDRSVSCVGPAVSVLLLWLASL